MDVKLWNEVEVMQRVEGAEVVFERWIYGVPLKNKDNCEIEKSFEYFCILTF